MLKICAPRFPKWCEVRIVVCLIVCLAFVLVGPVIAQPKPQDRIVRSVDSGQMIILQGNIHPLARAQYDQGSVSPDMPLHGVSLAFKLSASQQAALNQLLAEQRDPASPNYHKWLTPDEYAARFGMSQDDLDKVTGWLQAQGFTGIRISRSHNEVFFDGSAAQVESVFRAPLHHYLVNGKLHFANASAPALPAAFANVALTMRHLSDFRPQARARRVVPHFTSAQTGNHFLTPPDVATIYNLPSSFDGTGITIVVAGQTQLGTTATDVSDVNTFRSLSGLPSNPPQLLVTPNSGTSAIFANDVDEANLDVEWSGGVADGATILYDYAGNNTNFNVFDAWQDAIENDRGQIVSISYGLCESAAGAQAALALQQVAQQANVQGQTLTAASGDDGAADCDGGDANPPTAATQGISVDIPASIPEVTGLGGTEFRGDAAGVPNGGNAGGTQYWSGTTGGNDEISSALIYIPEMAWNDSPVTGTGPVPSTSLFASGGGASLLFGKPSWQTGTGVPDDSARDVPDVSLAGSPNHDGFLICSPALDQEGFQPCTNGFRDSSSNGNLDVFGGTSVDSQAFAGILAVLSQATNSMNGLGNINPTLYALAADTSNGVFHDITTGNNLVPCVPGSLDCPTSGAAQFGFSATTGYDEVTGLGTVDVNKLITAWGGFAPSADFSIEGLQTGVTAAGLTGTSTITLQGMYGFSSAVTLSCALTPPSSTAQITCGFTAPTSGPTTSVTLSGATPVTATLSITTAAAHALPSPSASARARGRFGWLAASGGGLFAGIFLVGVPGRRRRGTTILGLIVCGLLFTGIGCGGGSSSGNGNGGGGTGGTPVGNYVITVTATSGAITHTANVTMAVE